MNTHSLFFIQSKLNKVILICSPNSPFFYQYNYILITVNKHFMQRITTTDEPESIYLG